MTHLDIWRAANILLEHFHGEAVFIAARRADTLMGNGDRDGSRTWIRIAKAITTLEKQRPGKANTLH